MVSVNVNVEEFAVALQRFESEFESEVSKILTDSANILIKDAKQELTSHFQTHTGNAEKSIKVTKRTSDSIEIGIDDAIALYAIYLHEGTRAHMIEPRSTSALSWSDSGGTYFSKGHMVSGIQGHPFLTIAASNSENKISEMCEEHLQKAIEKSGL